jgi:hypothetical protein
MDYEDLISDLKRDAEERKDAVAALQEMRKELGHVIERLSGKARKKARSTGRGVTAEEVKRVANEIRTETPGLSGELLKSRVKERLKSSGRPLTGVGLRLAEVLAEKPTL